jgi:hypothetical protein
MKWRSRRNCALANDCRRDGFFGTWIVTQWHTRGNEHKHSDDESPVSLFLARVALSVDTWWSNFELCSRIITNPTNPPWALQYYIYNLFFKGRVVTKLTSITFKYTQHYKLCHWHTKPISLSPNVGFINQILYLFATPLLRPQTFYDR